MGFPCAGIKMPKPIREAQNLLTHVKFVFTITLFIGCLRVLNLWREGFFYKNQSYRVFVVDRPSPALVPVPVMSSAGAELIKKKLPVIEFGRFLEKLETQEEEYCRACAICMHGLESSHEIRELSNCNHAFHSHCLDRWVDKGQVTCPLCRSKLLPYHGKEAGGDEWRVERIAYLVGDDYVMTAW